MLDAKTDVIQRCSTAICILTVALLSFAAPASAESNPYACLEKIAGSFDNCDSTTSIWLEPIQATEAGDINRARNAVDMILPKLKSPALDTLKTGSRITLTIVLMSAVLMGVVTWLFDRYLLNDFMFPRYPGFVHVKYISLFLVFWLTTGAVVAHGWARATLPATHATLLESYIADAQAAIRMDEACDGVPLSKINEQKGSEREDFVAKCAAGERRVPAAHINQMHPYFTDWAESARNRLGMHRAIFSGRRLAPENWLSSEFHFSPQGGGISLISISVTALFYARRYQWLCRARNHVTGTGTMHLPVLAYIVAAFVGLAGFGWHLTAAL